LDVDGAEAVHDRCQIGPDRLAVHGDAGEAAVGGLTRLIGQTSGRLLLGSAQLSTISPVELCQTNRN
jgi:hypothetical protein